MEMITVSSTRNAVLTIGHSNHECDAFVALLLKHGVDTVVDVRSVPYSRYLPHFNREHLEEILKEADIRYTFRGKELGGQPADRACYDADGHVEYDELARTSAYREGIGLIVACASEGQVALMCSEKEPLDCHRTLLIAQTLAKQSISVAHINADGSLEPHENAINRLLTPSKQPYNFDLLGRSREEEIANAVACQARKVGARWPQSAATVSRWEREP